MYKFYCASALNEHFFIKHPNTHLHMGDTARITLIFKSAKAISNRTLQERFTNNNHSFSRRFIFYSCQRISSSIWRKTFGRISSVEIALTKTGVAPTLLMAILCITSHDMIAIGLCFTFIPFTYNQRHFMYDPIYYVFLYPIYSHSCNHIIHITHYCNKNLEPVG